MAYGVYGWLQQPRAVCCCSTHKLEGGQHKGEGAEDQPVVSTVHACSGGL
jgi:hypothetical protein